MSSLLRAVMAATVAAIEKPVQAGSRADASRAVRVDRVRSAARSTAHSAFDVVTRTAAELDTDGVGTADRVH